MHRLKVQLLLMAVLIGTITVMRCSPAGDVLTFENLVRHRETLLLCVQDHYGLSVVVFIAVYIFAVGLSIPGAEIMTIAAGFLFGTAAATVYVNIGATAGSALAFLSARYLLGTHLQKRYQIQLGAFNEEIIRNGPKYLLALRLVPLAPFFLVNFLSGLTKIPLKTFIWTTSLGIIPASALYAFAGKQLGSVQSPVEILSFNVVFAFVMLAILSLIPVALQHRKNAKNKRERTIPYGPPKNHN